VRSATERDLLLGGNPRPQRYQTNSAFLYRKSKGLSLVLVHGSVESTDAGAVKLYHLLTDGEWAVKDGPSENSEPGEKAETNYDEWTVEGDDQPSAGRWTPQGPMAARSAASATSSR